MVSFVWRFCMRPFLCLHVVLLGTLCPANAFDLTVLHTNDTHAAYGGTTGNGMPCYASLCEGGTGGSVRLKQLVDTIRAREDKVLFLDAGDHFQGTPFHTQYRGEMSAAVLNALEYDAFVPGNHEFDEGCEGFLRFLSKTRIPVLAANLRMPEKELSSRGSRLAPWRIVERAGRRIGLVGLVNEETPTSSSPCNEARFTGALAALEESVAALRQQGVDIIIALTHLGLAADRELARRVSGVDVIVGGHSHSLLSSVNPQADGPYPEVEKTPSGEPVLVVTAGSSGRVLGCLQVDFDDAGVARTWSGGPIPVDGRTPPEGGELLGPDPTLMALLETYSAPLEQDMKRPLGEIVVSGKSADLPLENPEQELCRKGECLSGNILLEALLWRGRDFGATIALCGGGTIRTPLHTGVVTRGDTITTMPFDNTLVVGNVSGTVLLEALEHGLSGYEARKGRFPQVAGLQYVADPRNPVGQRILSVSARTPQGNWEPVRPEQAYRMVTVDYLAEGGDGYGILSGVAWKYTGLSYGMVLYDFFMEHHAVTGALDGRITIR